MQIYLDHLPETNLHPVNLPMHSDSEEELIPHVPTSSGTGSSQRTAQYTDQEDGSSEDSQSSLMTAEQKICANTGSFTVPRDIKGKPVKGTFKTSYRFRCGFSPQKYTDKNHVDRLCKNMTGYGLVPTRADPCTYVYYGKQRPKSTPASDKKSSNAFDLEGAVGYLMDPVSGNDAKNRQVHEALSLHVVDLPMTGDDVFEKEIMGRLRKDFQVGSEDKNDCLFVGQRIHWKHDDKHGWYINVHQNIAIDELQEIAFDKKLKDDTPLRPQMHTAYRSVLGQINSLQSRTQFQTGYQFSRCTSKAASQTIEYVRAINKTVRTIKSIPLSMRFWPLHGKTRIVGYPDASYRNNGDKSSQRAHVIFLAEEQDLRRGASNSRGSLVDYETHKITATTMPTTVAEFHGLMRCYGSSLFLRGCSGFWSDITGEIADAHPRLDANNLVTTASKTHQPEQKETMRLIQRLRKESNSGQIA